MFFFTGYTWQNVLTAVVVLAALVALNEITRRYKSAALLIFLFLPIALMIFVWPETAVRGSGDWFPIVKTVSALAGVLGFMAIRYTKAGKIKAVLLFPFVILAINIAEAVYRDIEVFIKYAGKPSVFNEIDGLFMQGGPWNLMNAVAGIFLILTITGWFGIRIAKTKSRDMIWPDQLWFWVVAYDLWNWSYCYNCISTRAMYAGFLLLISCTIAEFFIQKGAYLQHRAHTLALWTMFSVTFSDYANPETAVGTFFSITSSYRPEALWISASLSLAFNAGLFIFMIYKSIRSKRNPYTKDLYSDLKAYRDVLESNRLN